MKKFFNSILFFVIVASNTIILSSNSIKMIITMGMINLVYLIWMNSKTNSEIYEITGVTWLQKKFKNNPLIMDMTNE